MEIGDHPRRSCVNGTKDRHCGVIVSPSLLSFVGGLEKIVAALPPNEFLLGALKDQSSSRQLTTDDR